MSDQHLDDFVSIKKLPVVLGLGGAKLSSIREMLRKIRSDQTASLDRSHQASSGNTKKSLGKTCEQGIHHAKRCRSFECQQNQRPLLEPITDTHAHKRQCESVIVTNYKLTRHQMCTKEDFS